MKIKFTDFNDEIDKYVLLSDIEPVFIEGNENNRSVLISYDTYMKLLKNNPENDIIGNSPWDPR
jgi:hypothetical protein